MASADDVVRETGWVFNNEVADSATLAEFVATGDDEVPAYLEYLSLRTPDDDAHTLVEIGSGIGRMTCAFTREFGSVIACDLDAGFLERCYETVGRFGKVDRLRTVHVADGRTLDLPDDSADLAFSYITLQHCRTDDALALAAEAVRVVKPGGRIALNFRAPAASDAVVVPAGALVRTSFRIPSLGDRLARRRGLARVAWQVSRLHPGQVIGALRHTLVGIEVWTNPGTNVTSSGAAHHTFYGINKHHWWLIATVADGNGVSDHGR
jgi:SAM-dependent methyltransferase